MLAFARWLVQTRIDMARHDAPSRVHAASSIGSGQFPRLGEAGSGVEGSGAKWKPGCSKRKALFARLAPVARLQREGLPGAAPVTRAVNRAAEALQCARGLDIPRPFAHQEVPLAHRHLPERSRK